jgi:hypothetical protein
LSLLLPLTSRSAISFLGFRSPFTNMNVWHNALSSCVTMECYDCEQDSDVQPKNMWGDTQSIEQPMAIMSLICWSVSLPLPCFSSCPWLPRWGSYN